MSKSKKAFKIILQHIEMKDLISNMVYVPQLTLVDQKTRGCIFKYKKNYDPGEGIHELLKDAFKEYVCEHYEELKKVLKENDASTDVLEEDFGFVDKHIDIIIKENSRQIFLNFI